LLPRGNLPDQRRRKTRILTAPLLAGLVIAGVTAMVMIMLGKAKRLWLEGLRRGTVMGR